MSGTIEPIAMRSRRGVRLAGRWHVARGECAVILCHGMESSKEGAKSVALAEMFAQRGVDAVRFDFSYVGESDGRFEDLTVSGEVEDLCGVWDTVRARVSGPISIVGSSLGGTVALLFAARERAVCSLATIAAVAFPGRRARELEPEERERWRRQGTFDLHGVRTGFAFLEDAESLDVPATIAALRCPLLLAHGSADAVVPVGDADAIAAAVGGPAEVRRYDGADHRFSDVPLLRAMLGDLVEWTVEQLRAAIARSGRAGEVDAGPRSGGDSSR